MALKSGLVPGVASVVSVAASIATLVLRAHPGVVGCPGSSASELINCQAVVGSAGGHILGWPLGFWGLVWLGIWWISRSLFRGRWSQGVAALGFIGVAYAIGTEVHVGHLCVWCSLDQLSIVTLSIWGITHRGGNRGFDYGPGQSSR